MDVEHWRPKAEVHEANGTVVRHQYSFLAADWANLLPSCIDCNRERIHEVVFPDQIRRKLTIGKGNRFPVQGTRAADRASLPTESALLLSPYWDTPEDHLEFLREGVVRSKNASAKAGNSIEVYALNRSGLVNERYERVLMVEKSARSDLNVWAGRTSNCFRGALTEIAFGGGFGRCVSCFGRGGIT
jgi:hypothetical protein